MPHIPTGASGQLALGAYRRDPDATSYVPAALDVLTLRGDHIAGVTAFRAPHPLPALRTARPASRTHDAAPR